MISKTPTPDPVIEGGGGLPKGVLISPPNRNQPPEPNDINHSNHPTILPHNTLTPLTVKLPFKNTDSSPLPMLPNQH